MKRATLSALRCPACRKGFEFSDDVQELLSGELVCSCGRTYKIEDGIPNLIYPDQLLPSDEEFKQKYDRDADKYEEGLDWLFRSFYQDENEARRSVVDLLNLRPSMRVLEVGCGTGKDSIQISNQLGESGELYLQDISRPMIRHARRRLADSPVRTAYLLGNASYLAFDDGYFDAVFHFGGINTFGDIGRAISEITRVVRVGGKVVIGDEGIAPWLRNKNFGQVLINANPLYLHNPPIDNLPEQARNVCLRWILGGAFYVIDYSIGFGPPEIDLDLPIPGKGDSLRSRYESRIKQQVGKLVNTFDHGG